MQILICRKGAKQAAEAAGTQSHAPCPLQPLSSSHGGDEAAALQHPSLSSQGQWGNPQRTREHISCLAGRRTERKSCAPTSLSCSQRYLPLLLSATLGNANMLPSRVTEKWAIKRNTWENRRDSTEAQLTFFSPMLT